MEERTAQGREHGLLQTLELVTERVAVCVTRCSRNFRYLWANQRYADWIQRPLDEIVGSSIIEVLGARAFESLRTYFERVLAGENVNYEDEIEVQGIGKRWISAAYTPTFDPDGVVEGWVAIVSDITDRKRAEEARFRHAAILESHQDAIITKDLNGIIGSWNIGAERMFGYKEAEVIGQPITILIPRELLSEEAEFLERLKSGGRIEHFETKRLTKAGAKVDVSLTIGPIKDSNGNVIGFCKIANDITQRKQAEHALKESEGRFRLVADSAPVMIWISGRDKLCSDFNKPWLDFTGRSLGQELGNGWAEGVHPEDLQACMETYAQSFDARKQFAMEYRLRRHDGEYRWIYDIGVPRSNADGSFAGYIGSCVDVTDKKSAEQELRQLNYMLQKQATVLQSRQELLKTFVRNVPAGVAMLDRDMRYIQASDRWCADYSLHISQILGRSHYEVFPDIPQRWREAHLRALAGETLRADEDLWDREDKQVWVRWELRPWREPSGAIGGILIFTEDVTDRKKAEQALSDMAGKLIEAHEEERTWIARELHDDVNQELALLAVELDRAAIQQDSVAGIKECLRQTKDRIAEIATDVQNLSHRLHSSKLDYLGLVRAAGSFCKELSEKTNVQVEFSHSNIPQDVPKEISLSLFRVMQEALNNAIKHSGGRSFRVNLQGTPEAIELTVADDGHGFNVQQGFMSEGLGLISMKERLHIVQGSLEIRSRPRSGTTIIAQVPVPASGTVAIAG